MLESFRVLVWLVLSWRWTDGRWVDIRISCLLEGVPFAFKHSSVNVDQWSYIWGSEENEDGSPFVRREGYNACQNIHFTEPPEISFPTIRTSIAVYHLAWRLGMYTTSMPTWSESNISSRLRAGAVAS